ncbi:hypothetical protein K7X08_018141 [Anisodus acutangulus]|uniref:Uncharacterized protein n=1 Tax=Anisodus acutangulus TaxID=402998 RepID=A0A9Q1LV34_9SOLA|nr:hypothetical protein K7X08_018141 [Anisodus acutangulus]
MHVHWEERLRNVQRRIGIGEEGGLVVWQTPEGVVLGDLEAENTDGRVPVLSTRYSLGALGLPITRKWRPWCHQKQVGGWVEEYKGLTFRGAGHAIPTFKPRSTFALRNLLDLL